MIRNCSFCSRAFVFSEEQEPEWRPGWLCPTCQIARASVPADVLAQPSAVDEITATFKDVMAHILVNCLDINDIVTADFPPEKAKYYKSGFTAAIVAVAMCVGVTDIANSGARAAIADALAATNARAEAAEAKLAAVPVAEIDR